MNASIDRKVLKLQAKDAIHDTKPNPMLVVLVMTLLTAVLGLLGLSINGSLDAYVTMYTTALNGQMIYSTPSGVSGPVGWLLSVALQVMTMEISVGFAIYSLRVWRREQAGVGNLFDSFGIFFRVIWISLLPSFLLSLWSMLYVIPVSALTILTYSWVWIVIGLPLLIPMYVAAYSYRQATFLMLDHPEMSCLRCITMSRTVMKGHKWELFKLDWSFFGWMLLCCIPLVGIVLSLWVSAYVNVTGAGFYERVMEQYRTRNAPPVGPQPPESTDTSSDTLMGP